MEESDKKKQSEQKVYEVSTLSVPFTLEETQENISISAITSSKPSKEQIINQAFKFHSQGKTLEAAKLYQYFINQGFNDHRVFSNYAGILQGIAKLEAAEISLRKAIEIKPDFAEAHSNLGSILKDLGKFQEAELSCFF